MARRKAEDAEVLTTPEACEFLRIDKRTFYNLVESGRIKAGKLERGYRVLKKNLIEFLDAAPTKGRRSKRKK